MFLTIWTGNQAAIQYAFFQDLVNEELTVESSIRDYLQSQGISCESIEATIGEFNTSQVTLKQGADSLLFIDFGCDLVGI
jgi:hypothetical protein